MSATQRNCATCAHRLVCAASREAFGCGTGYPYWSSADASGTDQEAQGGANAQRRHSHYFKDVSGLATVDVYRVLALFNVTDPCLQHAVKKLLVAGGRGAGKDIGRDVKEAMDTLARWVEMRAEDEGRAA